MKSKEHWQQYKEYTQELTANCRKLAFAAAAICWLFRSSEYQFPQLILWALGLIIAFFICDILQYLIAAVLLKKWLEEREQISWEQHGMIENDDDKPKSLDVPAYRLWKAKIGFLLASYGCIGIYIVFL
jgi:hypothetical protein